MLLFLTKIWLKNLTDYWFVRGSILPNSNESQNYKIESNYLIYPNPSSGLINIRFKNKRNRTIEILNLRGNIISSTFSDGLQSQINITTKGLFFVKISQSDKVFIEKVIIN